MTNGHSYAKEEKMPKMKKGKKPMGMPPAKAKLRGKKPKMPPKK